MVQVVGQVQVLVVEQVQGTEQGWVQVLVPELAVVLAVVLVMVQAQEQGPDSAEVQGRVQGQVDDSQSSLNVREHGSVHDTDYQNRWFVFAIHRKCRCRMKSDN
jgi:hypothetical protein